jgi:hypothetical protein
MLRNNFIAAIHHIKSEDQSQSNLFKQAKFFFSTADIQVSTLGARFVVFVIKRANIYDRAESSYGKSGIVDK